MRDINDKTELFVWTARLTSLNIALLFVNVCLVAHYKYNNI